MSPGPAKVLVVDDEPHICSLIRDSLTAAGVQCCTATEVCQAKELLRRQSFGVMVTDILMPQSGLELIDYARQVAPRCKVIVITGVSCTQTLAETLRLGACDYVEKPFDLNCLVEAVKRALRDSGNLGQLPLRAARAIEREKELRQSSLQSIRALVRAVEAKDPYTRRHSEQVAHYATSLASHLGLPWDQVESIRLAALVHDVGKIGVPDQVLNKVGPLTWEEFQHVRRHPALGQEIVKTISAFAAEAAMVRHHHENWDGSGYPDGLSGLDIPLVARIINVADSIDAMLMRRSYKTAYSVEVMLGELARCAGSQFQPELAAEAIRWCREHPDKLILANEDAEGEATTGSESQPAGTGASVRENPAGRAVTPSVPAAQA